MEDGTVPVILAIDVGTSALKAVLFNRAGRVLAAATRPYAYTTPQPGWGEADPAGWWAALGEALAQLHRSEAGLGAVEIIGLTGQMHTAVLLDGAGQPLPPTILWLDRRATAELADLQASLGLPPYQLNSTFTLPKLLWLARHRPAVLAQTRMLLWPKDYLRYRLTGRYQTDVTEAAGAALLDWGSRTWATERLAGLPLTPEALPPLYPAEAEAGPLLPEVAAALHLPPQARVIVGAGDVIALLGTAPPRPGRVAYSLGSSTMLSCALPPGQPAADPAHRLYVYPFLPYRLLNGVLSTSGASVTWAWQALYEEQVPFEEVIRAAGSIPAGAEGLVYLPFLAGERCPYWNDRLRGGFYGLTLAHQRGHMVRAVLEGVAYSLRHLLEISQELGVTVHEIALAGGGATIPGWPQLIADVCQQPLALYAGRETVTRPLYAYCLHALDPAIPFEQALEQTFETPERLEPWPDLAETYNALYRRYRQLADFAAGL